MIYDRIWEKYDRLRFLYLAVFRRIRSRTYTIVIRSLTYTIVIRSQVLWRNTFLYGASMALLRSYTTPYTESITVDLGCYE